MSRFLTSLLLAAACSLATSAAQAAEVQVAVAANFAGPVAKIAEVRGTRVRLAPLAGERPAPPTLHHHL